MFDYLELDKGRQAYSAGFFIRRDKKLNGTIKIKHLKPKAMPLTELTEGTEQSDLVSAKRMVPFLVPSGNQKKKEKS